MLLRLFVNKNVSVESNMACFVANSIVYFSTWIISLYLVRSATIYVCDISLNTPNLAIFSLPSPCASVKETFI